MYAIVEIAGLQYKVEKDQRLYVNRLNVAKGKKVKFDRVLLTEEKGDVKVGAPVIDGAVVEATVNGEVKGDKILVFKKKRRKGYQKMNGHRQMFTSITINKITAKAPAKKAAAKATEDLEAAPKKAASKKTAAKKATTAKKPAAKKPTTKKATAAKKPAAKKPATKKVSTAKKPAAKKTTTAKKPASKKAAPKKAEK
ncbi:MAG: 50S ribosomal protein L21 [Flavobacteriales bacterium]|nr:50S ribosomal protein L21 [Cryomorphaceae bacterium]|tara:strand:+ start:449 stop:1039 length:591 start_codon:yes stop_codon:yes gene_type:complete